MICGLGITECLLAASGENVPEWGGRPFKGESETHMLIPVASCLVSRWLIACSISNGRECQLWVWKKPSFITTSCMKSWDRIFTTAWHFRRLYLCAFDSPGPPAPPRTGHYSSVLDSPLELVTEQEECLISDLYVPLCILWGNSEWSEAGTLRAIVWQVLWRRWRKQTGDFREGRVEKSCRWSPCPSSQNNFQVMCKTIEIDVFIFFLKILWYKCITAEYPTVYNSFLILI